MESSRRSIGILKAQKPRNPLGNVELDVPQAVTPSTSRRVSFAASNFVKPFSKDLDIATAWDQTYEEDMHPTDSMQSSNDQLTPRTGDSMNSSFFYTEESEEVQTKIKITQELPKIYIHTENRSKNQIIQKCDEKPLLDKENVNPIINDLSIISGVYTKRATLEKKQDGMLGFDGIFDDTIENVEIEVNQSAHVNIDQLLGLESNSIAQDNMKFVIDQEQSNNQSKRKTLIVDESQADTKYTTDLVNLPCTKGDLGAKHYRDSKRIVIYDAPQTDMDLTHDLLILSDPKIDLEVEKDNVLNKKSILFDAPQAGMELTCNLPILSCPKDDLEVQKDGDSKREAIMFKTTQADKELTCSLPIFSHQKDNFEVKNDKDLKRKSILFEVPQADIELNCNLPSLTCPIGDLEVETDRDSKRKTILFEMTQADLELPCNLPILSHPNGDMEVEKDKDLKRKSILFESPQTDMEGTCNLSFLSCPIGDLDVEKDRDSKKKSMIYKATQELTCNLPVESYSNGNLKVKKDGDSRRKTLIFEDSQANMDITCGLPSVLSPEDHIQRRKDMNYTEISSNCKIEMDLKRKTLTFDDPQISSKEKLEEISRNKTIIFEQSNQDLKVTSNFANSQHLKDKMGHQEEEEKKNIILRNAQTNIEFTCILPIDPCLQSDMQTEKENSSVITLKDGLITEIDKNSRKKTIMFEKSQVTGDFLSNVPADDDIVPQKRKRSDARMNATCNSPIFIPDHKTLDEDVQNINPIKINTTTFDATWIEMETNTDLPVVANLSPNIVIEKPRQENDMEDQNNRDLMNKSTLLHDLLVHMKATISPNISNNAEVEEKNININKEISKNVEVSQLDATNLSNNTKIVLLEKTTLDFRQTFIIDRSAKDNNFHVIDNSGVEEIKVHSPTGEYFANHSGVPQSNISRIIPGDSFANTPNFKIHQSPVADRLPNKMNETSFNLWPVNSPCMDNENTLALINARVSDSILSSCSLLQNTENPVLAESSFFETSSNSNLSNLIQRVKEQMVPYEPINLKPALAMMEDSRSTIEKKIKQYYETVIKATSFPIIKRLGAEDSTCTVDEEVACALVDDKMPVLPSKSLLEKIIEADQRASPSWKFERQDNEIYHFSTFNGTLKFSVEVPSEFENIGKITTSVCLKEDSDPFYFFVIQLFLERLDMKHLDAALHSKQDILSFLEYVYMLNRELLLQFWSYQSWKWNYKLYVTPDFKFNFDVIDYKILVRWHFEVDMNNCNKITPDDISVTAKYNADLNEEEVKLLCYDCPKGLNFLKEYIKRIQKYMNEVQRPKYLKLVDELYVK